MAKLVYLPRAALVALAALVVVLYECGKFYASVSQEELSPSASLSLEEPFPATNEPQSLPVQKDFSPASSDNQKERIKEIPAAGSSSSISQGPEVTQAAEPDNVAKNTQNFSAADVDDIKKSTNNEALKSIPTAPIVELDSKTKGGEADQPSRTAMGEGKPTVNTAPVATIKSDSQAKGDEADQSPRPMGEGNATESTKTSFIARSSDTTKNATDAAVSRLENASAIVFVKERVDAERVGGQAMGQGNATEGAKNLFTAESSNSTQGANDAAVSRSETTAAIATAESDSKTKGGARLQASKPLRANSTFEYLCRDQKTKVHFPAELLSRVTEQGSLSLIIESYDVAGNLRTNCSDYFVANLTGPAIYSPPVVCGLDGRYVIRVSLIESGIYRLVIRALGAVGKIKGNDTCFPADPHSYVIGPETTSACPAFEFEYKPNPAFANPNAAQSTSCNPKDFYSGRIVETPTNLPFGGQQNVTWRPLSNCDWPAYWAPERLKRCLAGKWIIFIGDSTIHEISCGLMKGFYGGFDPSWSPSRGVCPRDGPVTSSSCPRIFDTGHIDPTKPRITYYWTGHKMMCNNCGGLASVLRDKQSLQRILDLQGPEGHRTQADLLVFNSGLHDLCHAFPKANFQDFRRNLGEMMGFLKPLAKQAVWKSINPKLANRTCDNFFGHAARVPWMNEQAVQVARTYGFQIADSYPMLLSATAGNDGRHCRGGPICKFFEASMLNYLCAP